MGMLPEGSFCMPIDSYLAFSFFRLPFFFLFFLFGVHHKRQLANLILDYISSFGGRVI